MVTGAGSGIGRAIACRLGADRMRLGLVARTHSALEETASLVRDAGGEALVLPCDLRDADAVEATVRAAATELGGLHALVNNAAVGAFWQLDSTDVARFDDVLAANLRGAFACIQAALPHLRAAGSARIVNIASRAAQEGYPYLAAYSASKHGLVGLSESVDAEPSHPSPTGTPAARNSGTGAIPPPPISMFELGQCATPVPHLPRRAISASFG